jgi:Methyltransferase domain
MVGCRLCHGPVDKQFGLRLLGRHEVNYSRCRDCGSLQTDEPYWLTEAYATSLTVSDVGAVRRCLTCRAVIWLVLRSLRQRQARLLDFGGGSGLLCRLLRDVGIDAWTCDAYGSSEYALRFQADIDTAEPGSFDVVTAFEVLEHLPHPDRDLEKLFRLCPQILLASTEPYLDGSDASWWYLSPHTGQHVFFYSPRGLQTIADRFGYALLSIGGWHLFTRRPIGAWTRRLLRRLLSARSLMLWRVILEAMPSQAFVTRDHQLSLRCDEAAHDLDPHRKNF